MGRPTVPVSTYIRLMYFKRRYNLGYETLVKEVSDSFHWRRFCQIPFDEKVPDASTLIKLTHKYGDELVEELNQLLLSKLKEKRLLKSKKLRIDTTVVESDIHYPTDIRLLGNCISSISTIVKKIKRLGVSTKASFVDHRRKVKKNLILVGKLLRNKGQKTKEAINKYTRELLRTTKETLTKTRSITNSCSYFLKGDGLSDISRNYRKVSRLKRDLIHTKRLTRNILRQTEDVLQGKRHIPKRVVSLFDPEARPIKKGKLSSPVEFGRKIILQETESGFISHYKVLKENPNDAKLLKPAIRAHKKFFGNAPPEIALDRGFYSKPNETYLARQGVQKVSIPKRGKKDRVRKIYERQYFFKRLQRFRAGMEAKINLLKSKFGLERSLLRGTLGTQIWIGWGILGHNLWQMARTI